MIQLSDIKPCSDYRNRVQAEGLITETTISLNALEFCLRERNFKVFSIGDPLVLVCRRGDCMLLVKANGTFTISEVSSEEKLTQIIQEIEELL
jgi:hypothetical protein